ncbi:IS66 family insertion sequence element accessory protein TnpA [Persicobacter diffluens]|uniref:Transposase n=1 Tax=Persicobacter diffluens TaxID=981 RepID=A0AAN5AQQ2_9BACT|nr:hypothetical protein PEDI_52150 [Persicobacter diffluens]GJM65083.1 hypothetical protein PEDI_56350 [Persicobacter diffluens]
MSFQERKMFALVDKKESSNLKTADFCKAEGISLACFYKWKRKKQEYEENEDPFIELEIEEAEEQEVPGEIELHFPNGTKMFFPANIPLSYLERLVKVC